MAKQYNVNRENKDPFYRYKMPAIIAKVEGKGNGIKTVIVNMVDIARALNRPPMHPTKYFGCELGAQIFVDVVNERYIVNGSHDDAKLQEHLDGFIKKFVLCPECENPETTLTVKNYQISQGCQACGKSAPFRHQAHRLSTFIVQQQKKTAKDKKDKKKNGEQTNTVKDIYKKDQIVVQKSQKKDEWEGEDWSESDEEDLANGVQQIALEDMKPEDMSSEQKGAVFTSYVENLVKTGKIKDPTIPKEISFKADYYGVRSKASTVLVEKLLDPKDLVGSLKANRRCFMRLTHTDDGQDDMKAQKYFMSAYEIFFEKNEDLVKYIAHATKVLYDECIIGEEMLIEWGNSKPSKKYVRKELSSLIREKVKVVVDWLEKADEESSEDEVSEKEDSDVEFGNDTTTPATNATPTFDEDRIAVENQDGNIEEIDIDDI